MKFIIEGIDRLGKDTLINQIIQHLGFHFVIHYTKPQKIAIYDNDLFKYQKTSFEYGFKLLSEKHNIPIIFNRFHLGECVYSPLYRGYSGNYVFDMEQDYSIYKIDNIKLILLTTSDFSFLKDDGKSFNFKRKTEEQELFKFAFNRSKIKNKKIIDINNNGYYKDPKDILKEALCQ
jgi:hypothetical protein